ncbi:MAG: YabP/YqfC family sporulation protein [Oscillospiraceae bacterium]|nr:YabP/YqfC family sporulation protein [Oscillospiraceae bacterium]
MRQNKEKQKCGVARTILRELDMPPSSVNEEFHLEMSGNKEAVLQGCKGVLEYSDTAVRINTGARGVVFKGMGLEMKTFASGQAVVEGLIVSVEFD